LGAGQIQGASPDGAVALRLAAVCAAVAALLFVAAPPVAAAPGAFWPMNTPIRSSAAGAASPTTVPDAPWPAA
jgi:hypothetical protein